MNYRDIYDLYIKDYIEDGRGNMVKERVKQQLAEYHCVLKQLNQLVEDLYVNGKNTNR